MAKTEARKEAEAETGAHPSEPSPLARMKELTRRIVQVHKSDLSPPKRRRPNQHKGKHD